MFVPFGRASGLDFKLHCTTPHPQLGSTYLSLFEHLLCVLPAH